MNFDAMAYPDTFIIDSLECKGHRDPRKSEVKVPYTNEPNVSIGDVITQKVGKGEVQLKILDMAFLPGGSLNVGTNHPNLLTLNVENITSNEHKPKQSQSTYNIGSISGNQVQIGESNHMLVNISITELIDKVAKSGDPQAKSILKQLLENSTVASIVGAGASALLGLL